MITDAEVFILDTKDISGMRYDNIYDFECMYKAYRASLRGKCWKASTNRYRVNALERIVYQKNALKKREYEMGNYNVFKITEPKERTIKATSFSDKVVQRSLCDNVLEPVFERSLIYDNYACRRGKGTHAALKRTEQFYRQAFKKHGLDVWVLKCDVEKYFDSIDHEELKKLMRKYFNEPDLLGLLDNIISSSGGSCGVPIGNQSSQWFAITFLNGLDHLIKEKLRIKWYVRYMDDFMLVHHDREYLRYCKRVIEEYLAGLKLSLNGKSHIFPLAHGVDFLGFHTYVTSTGKLIKKVRHDSNKRIKRKLKKFKVLYEKGERSEKQISQAYNSWKNHAKHGDSFYLRKMMDEKYKIIFEKD